LFKVGQPDLFWAAFYNNLKKYKMKEKRTIISLPLDLHTELKKYAAINRISMKEIIIQAVEAAIYQKV
jgi:hypothetical protein